MTPAILGLSHLTLSVRDRAAAQQFWVDFLGFEVLFDEPEYCFTFDRGARLAILLTDHDRSVSGAFDERRPGLDHLALAVPDVESLLSWEQRLSALGVPHSPIVETDAGHHLNLRAPDNVAIEMYVMSSTFAELIGLEVGAEPVAATV